MTGLPPLQGYLVLVENSVSILPVLRKQICAVSFEKLATTFSLILIVFARYLVKTDDMNRKVEGRVLLTRPARVKWVSRRR